jgi:hypothetical protein
MLSRGLESRSLWSIMLNYSKFIAENVELETKVKNRCRLNSIRASTFNSELSSRMRHYFDAPKCGALRVSISKDTFGRIEWYSHNIRSIYGAEGDWSPQGHSVSIFLPEDFRESHEKVMLGWYHNPKSRVLE